MAKMFLDPLLLTAIMRTLSIRRATQLSPFLQAAMDEFCIDTPKRVAAFVAQLAHESRDLRDFREIWGPTPAQLKYEGRKDLGNNQPGDGHRYLGRGPLQITGRANYRKYGSLLGVALEAQPDLAELPEYAFRIAGSFWALNGLNELADQDLFTQITHRINGGLNGARERLAYYHRALPLLERAAQLGDHADG